MRTADAPAAAALTYETFADLERRVGIEPEPPRPFERIRARYEHPIATDPGGCWVAEDGGRLVGVAIALLREGLWHLSLLVVDPARQSGGTGRALLAAAHEYAHGARGRMVLSSPDPRALRAYQRLGLAVHPCADAHGRPRDVPAAEPVRPMRPGDEPLIDAVGRAMRGAGHRVDLDAMLTYGARVLVHPERGFAVARPGAVNIVAAHDEDAARDLLRTILARTDGEIEVPWLTSHQQWAFEVCLEAGLRLRAGGGALLLDGDVGPFRPYIPSGAYG